MVLFLNQKEIEGLADIEVAVEALDTAFQHWSSPSRSILPRMRMPTPPSNINFMAAALPDGDYFGYRAAHYPMNFNWLVLLSLKAGGPVAVMECGWIARTRTGAASGVATRYLAREDAKSMAIIGTGRQSGDQVRGVVAVRPIETVSVYSRDPEKRTAFANSMADELGLPVIAAETPEACVAGADIVTTSTNSADPVLKGAWLEPGMHINGIGANGLARRELDDDAVLAADLVVVDSLEQAPLEAGALVELEQQGKLSWSDIAELGTVVETGQPCRTSDDQITFFHSLGLTFEDVALAAKIYEKAVASGVGNAIPGTDG